MIARVRPIRTRLTQVLAKGGDARRFIGALAPTIAALAIQFLAFIVTARGLGVEALGQYAALLGLAAIGVELVSIGTADTLVRAVSRDPQSFRRYFGHMLVVMAIATPPALAFLTWIASTQVQSPLGLHLIVLALAGEILTARFAYSVEMIMVAHQDTVRAGVVRFVTSAARLLAAVAYFSFRSDLRGWIFAVALQGALLSCVALAWTIRRYGPPRLTLLRHELHIGTIFGINQVALASQNNLDRVVLGRFTTDAAVGVYVAGSRVLQVGLLPIQVVTRILYPRFFQIGTEGITATRRFAVRNLPTMIAAGLVSTLGVAIVAMTLPTVLGKTFAASQWAAIQLSCMLPFLGVQYLAADALTGAGYQTLRAAIYVSAALTFGLGLAFGAWLGGMEGVIIAFVGGHALLAALLWAAVFIVERRQHAPLSRVAIREA